MSETAYIAALEREVTPLIRRWQRIRRAYTGRNFDFFENGATVLVCGGIGPEAARRATEAVIALYQPKELVSVGFAGALNVGIHVGDIAEPALVVDSRDGARMATDVGTGVLVSFGSVAGVEQKEKLARAYSAQTVDMEAASVARCAQLHNLHFRAVKVVSDEFEFAMPPLDRFVAADGSFQAARFVFFAALRPALWPAVLRLARNSARASRALSERLAEDLNHVRESPQAAAVSVRKQ